MKSRLMLFSCVCVLAAVPSIASAQKLIILVRHAERADAGMASKETDPLLSPAGTARAARLSTILADAGITAIFVTQFRRTQDTAKPLADKLNIRPTATPNTTTDALVALLRSRHANDVVLIVGHSDTVPAIIKALRGPVVTIADNEFDNMFFIVPATGLMTRLHY